MTFGVLLIALGKGVYGQLALNCALSVKSQSASTPIYLLADLNGVDDLNSQHLRYFDDIKFVTSDFYEFEGKPSFFRVKTRLHEITPFHRTLYLDSDVLLFQNNYVNSFESKTGFIAQCWNLIDLDTKKSLSGDNYRVGTWMHLDKMREVYGLSGKKFMQINSSLIFFDSSDSKTIEYLDLVKELAYSKNKELKAFRGDVPDEFFYHLASAKMGFYQKKIPYTPLWGHMDSSFEGITHLLDTYKGIMMYGVQHPLHAISIYNNRLEQLYSRFKIKSKFYYVSKKEYGIRAV